MDKIRQFEKDYNRLYFALITEMGNYGVAETARILGISKSLISRYLKGEKRIASCEKVIEYLKKFEEHKKNK